MTYYIPLQPLDRIILKLAGPRFLEGGKWPCLECWGTGCSKCGGSGVGTREAVQKWYLALSRESVKAYEEYVAALDDLERKDLSEDHYAVISRSRR